MSEKQGDLFKSREAEMESTLDDYPLYAFRIDGRKFSTYTRKFVKPFDPKLSRAMEEATKSVLENVLTRKAFGYTQSDEISVLVKREDLVFNKRFGKLLSLTASAASVGFYKQIGGEDLPLFDSRVFGLKSFEEAHEYIDWRRLDARKNAISAYGEHNFGRKSLMGMSTKERLELLHRRIDNFHIDDRDMWGALIVRNKRTRMDEAGFDRWTVEPALRDVTERSLRKLF